MLHISLLDVMLIGLVRIADLCYYDIYNDKDYIDFVRDMTDMEIGEGVTEFSMDFVNRLTPIYNKLDLRLKELREEKSKISYKV